MATPLQTAQAALARASKPTAKVTPEQLATLKRDHTALKIADYVARAVAEAPPLTDDQKARIVALLNGGAQ